MTEINLCTPKSGIFLCCRKKRMNIRQEAESDIDRIQTRLFIKFINGIFYFTNILLTI